MSRITRRQAKNRTGLRVANRRATRLAVEALEPRELLSVEPHVLLTYQNNGSLGTSVAGVGDVNGDGLSDVALGRPSDGSGVVFYSGAENYVLKGAEVNYGSYEGRYFGRSLSSLGDVNGDGIADLVVGGLNPAYNFYPWTAVGKACVVSGSTGAELFCVSGVSGDASFGSSVAGVGDINLDGSPDFAVGDPAASPGGLASAGSVFV